MNLLAWYNAIFFVPFALSALLLLLSALRIGGHHGHGGRVGGHMRGPAGHARASVGARHSGGAKQGAKKLGVDSAPMEIAHPNDPLRTIIGALIGIGKAPLLTVLELFFIAFGLFGLLANKIWMTGDHPLAAAVVPSLVVALIAGYLLARLSAALLTKILPDDAISTAIPREGLLGLTGQIAYPASVSSGRIHVYDQYGSLHDESCRTTAADLRIARGAQARIVDVAPDGRLIVETV